MKFLDPSRSWLSRSGTAVRRFGLAGLVLLLVSAFGVTGVQRAEAVALSQPKPNLDRVTQAIPGDVVQVRRGRGFRGYRGFRGRAFRGRGFRGRRFYGPRIRAYRHRPRFRRYYRPRLRFYYGAPIYYYGVRSYSPYRCYRRCRHHGYSKRYCRRRCY